MPFSHLNRQSLNLELCFCFVICISFQRRGATHSVLATSDLNFEYFFWSITISVFFILGTVNLIKVRNDRRNDVSVITILFTRRQFEFTFFAQIVFRCYKTFISRLCLHYSMSVLMYLKSVLWLCLIMWILFQLFEILNGFSNFRRTFFWFSCLCFPLVKFHINHLLNFT